MILRVKVDKFEKFWLHEFDSKYNLKLYTETNGNQVDKFHPTCNFAKTIYSNILDILFLDMGNDEYASECLQQLNKNGTKIDDATIDFDTCPLYSGMLIRKRAVDFIYKLLYQTYQTINNPNLNEKRTWRARKRALYKLSHERERLDQPTYGNRDNSLHASSSAPYTPSLIKLELAITVLALRQFLVHLNMIIQSYTEQQNRSEGLDEQQLLDYQHMMNMVTARYAPELHSFVITSGEFPDMCRVYVKDPAVVVQQQTDEIIAFAMVQFVTNSLTTPITIIQKTLMVNPVKFLITYCKCNDSMLDRDTRLEIVRVAQEYLTPDFDSEIVKHNPLLQAIAFIVLTIQKLIDSASDIGMQQLLWERQLAYIFALMDIKKLAAANRACSTVADVPSVLCTDPIYVERNLSNFRYISECVVHTELVDASVKNSLLKQLAKCFPFKNRTRDLQKPISMAITAGCTHKQQHHHNITPYYYFFRSLLITTLIGGYNNAKTQLPFKLCYRIINYFTEMTPHKLAKCFTAVPHKQLQRVGWSELPRLVLHDYLVAINKDANPSPFRMLGISYTVYATHTINACALFRSIIKTIELPGAVSNMEKTMSTVENIALNMFGSPKSSQKIKNQDLMLRIKAIKKQEHPKVSANHISFHQYMSKVIYELMQCKYIDYMLESEHFVLLDSIYASFLDLRNEITRLTGVEYDVRRYKEIWQLAVTMNNYYDEMTFAGLSNSTTGPAVSNTRTDPSTSVNASNSSAGQKFSELFAKLSWNSQSRKDVDEIIAKNGETIKNYVRTIKDAIQNVNKMFKQTYDIDNFDLEKVDRSLRVTRTNLANGNMIYILNPHEKSDIWQAILAHRSLPPSTSNDKSSDDVKAANAELSMLCTILVSRLTNRAIATLISAYLQYLAVSATCNCLKIINDGLTPYEFGTLFFYLHASHLYRIKVVDLPIETSSRIDYAMIRCRFNGKLSCIEQIPDEAYDIYYAICCNRIATFATDDPDFASDNRMGNGDFAYNIQTGYYECSKSTVGQQRKSVYSRLRSHAIQRQQTLQESTVALTPPFILNYEPIYESKLNDRRNVARDQLMTQMSLPCGKTPMMRINIRHKMMFFTTNSGTTICYCHCPTCSRLTKYLTIHNHFPGDSCAICKRESLFELPVSTCDHCKRNIYTKRRQIYKITPDSVIINVFYYCQQCVDQLLTEHAIEVYNGCVPAMLILKND